MTVFSTGPVLSRESGLVCRRHDRTDEWVYKGPAGTGASLHTRAHLSPELTFVFSWSDCQSVVDGCEEGPFLLRLDCRELRCRTGNRIFHFPLQPWGQAEFHWSTTIEAFCTADRVQTRTVQTSFNLPADAGKMLLMFIVGEQLWCICRK